MAVNEEACRRRSFEIAEGILYRLPTACNEPTALHNRTRSSSSPTPQVSFGASMCYEEGMLTFILPSKLMIP